MLAAWDQVSHVLVANETNRTVPILMRRSTSDTDVNDGVMLLFSPFPPP